MRAPSHTAAEILQARAGTVGAGGGGTADALLIDIALVGQCQTMAVQGRAECMDFRSAANPRGALIRIHRQNTGKGLQVGNNVAVDNQFFVGVTGTHRA